MSAFMLPAADAMAAACVGGVAGVEAAAAAQTAAATSGARGVKWWQTACRRAGAGIGCGVAWACVPGPPPKPREARTEALRHRLMREPKEGGGWRDGYMLNIIYLSQECCHINIVLQL